MGVKEIKADRIREGYYEDWDSLIKDHPEITLKKVGSRVIGVNLPETAVNPTWVIVNNKVYTLEYYDSSKPTGEDIIHYISPYARESELYRIINELKHD